MGRLGLALRLFFKILGDAIFAQKLTNWMEVWDKASAKASPTTAVTALPTSTNTSTPHSTSPAATKSATSPAIAPLRSDAVTLLSLLQRQARLVDFLKEKIDDYNDAQIGAAVREVHRDAAAVLEQCFAIKPVLEQAEGSTIALGENYDAAKIKLTGNATTPAPASGTLQHAGWQVIRVDLPTFTGTKNDASLIAQAQVEA